MDITLTNKVRFQQKTALFLCGLLSLSSVLVLVNTVIDLRELAPPALTATTAIKPNTLTHIANQHLFGRLQNNRTLPTTRLPLVLQGIIVSSTSGLSRAIISAQHQPAKVYTTGATVPGGAIIQSIDKNQVVLQYQRQRTRLKLHQLRAPSR